MTQTGHPDAEPAAADTAAAHALVRRFWALYQARRWREAEALLAPEARCRWWASREQFDGAGAVVHVNEVYPEGWQIHLLELHALPDGRVLSLVRVDQGEALFYANSYCRLRDGRIAELDEYWCDAQPAPPWRRDPSAPLPGLSPLATDQRRGLSLALE